MILFLCDVIPIPHNDLSVGIPEEARLSISDEVAPYHDAVNVDVGNHILDDVLTKT